MASRNQTKPLEVDEPNLSPRRSNRGRQGQEPTPTSSSTPKNLKKQAKIIKNALSPSSDSSDSEDDDFRVKVERADDFEYLDEPEESILPHSPQKTPRSQRRKPSSSKNPDFIYYGAAFDPLADGAAVKIEPDNDANGSKRRGRLPNILKRKSQAEKKQGDSNGDHYLGGKKVELVLNRIDSKQETASSKRRLTKSGKKVEKGQRSRVVIEQKIEYPELEGADDDEDSILLEVCIDNYRSIVSAGKGGAKRIELCSSLAEGGLTPTPGLLRMAKASLKIPVFVMIRPRGGDFVYTNEEIEIMTMDIVQYKKLGADGFVFGVLDKNGHIDKAKCKILLKAADPLPCTFHRAFDVCQNRPIQALETIVDLGFARLLTSGQQPSAEKGIPYIRQLVRAAGSSICIMAGAGVTPANVAKIIKETGVREVHGSARVEVKSTMKRAGQSGVSMGASGTDDSSYFATDANIVATIVKNASEAVDGKMIML